MAVRLSSDLIMDVMRNANPAKRDSAVARLQSFQSQESQVFAEAMNGVQISSGSPALTMPASELVGDSKVNSKDTNSQSAYQGFERMVLRNIFETLLPEEKSGAFGGGPSAGVWRSMAADQLAGVYSASGRVGIARMLESAKSSPPLERDSQWPYFSSQSIKTFTS